MKRERRGRIRARWFRQIPTIRIRVGICRAIVRRRCPGRVRLRRRQHSLCRRDDCPIRRRPERSFQRLRFQRPRFQRLS